MLLSGCQKKQEDNSKKNANNQTVQQNKNESNGSNNHQSTTNKLSENIQKLFQSGKKIKCVYHDSEIGSGFTVTTYIDSSNNHYRTEFTDDQGKKNITIFDGNVMYTWQEGTNMGTKMSQDCIKELRGSSDSEPVTEDEKDEEPTDIKEKLSLFQDVQCSPTNNVDLTLPTNVKFVDQCEMLKKQQEALKGMQEKMKNIPGVPSDAISE